MVHKVLLVVFVVLFTLSACTATADTRERDEVQTQQELYRTTQPIPYFEWSLQRHLMIELYKNQNQAVATWSYVWDQLRGKVSWQCASVGYPIPGGTQLTNPEQLAYSKDAVIPQAEPNGLFSPTTSSGTYVMCVNEDGTVSPVYLEELVRTFPYPMQEVGGELVRVPGTQPSYTINPNREIAP